MKNLTLIIDGKKQDFQITAFEIGYNLYEETDVAIIIYTNKVVEEGMIAEGVGKPSEKGIYDEGKFETVELEETLYKNLLLQGRSNYSIRIIDETKGYRLSEKLTLSTNTYSFKEVEKGIAELVALEKTLSENYFIKVAGRATFEFVKSQKDKLYIIETVELYEKENAIEEAKFEEKK